MFKAGNFMAGDFLAGNFVEHRVTFGNFMVGNLFAGDFLGWYRKKTHDRYSFLE